MEVVEAEAAAEVLVVSYVERAVYNPLLCQSKAFFLWDCVVRSLLHLALEPIGVVAGVLLSMNEWVWSQHSLASAFEAANSE
jgi:hypothetical protein